MSSRVSTSSSVQRIRPFVDLVFLGGRLSLSNALELDQADPESRLSISFTFWLIPESNPFSLTSLHGS